MMNDVRASLNSRTLSPSRARFAEVRGDRATTAAGRVVSKPNDNVQLGDSGAGVRQIQNALIAKGYKITVDGSFGSQTDNAVKDFQTKNSLKADGIVGPATWAKLSSTTNTATTTTTTKR